MKAKDKVKSQNVSAVNLPKLKGEVCIQLRNAETGELEQEVKGENMVTNAVRDIFADNYFGRLGYRQISPITKTLFGGLLCFQNALTEDADNYFVPTSNVNPVIAHAGQTTYSQASDDTTRGNPNDVSSGEVTNGYQFVWDFASTQGNGTISALALTHKDFGDYYFYNSALNPIVTSYQPTNTEMYPNINPPVKLPILFDPENRRAFTIIDNLTVREFVNFGLVDGYGINQVSDYSPEYTDHSLTSMPNTYNYYRWFMKDGNIHAVYGTGSTLYITVINTTTWTVTHTSQTVSGANFSFSTTGTDTTDLRTTRLMPNGHLMLPGSGKVYDVNYSNFADVTEIDASIYNNRSIIMLGSVGLTYDNNLLIEGNKTHPCVSPVQDMGYVDYGSVAQLDGLVAMRSNRSRVSTESFGYTPLISKLFLSTIKNLDNPVTKTATQTMQITYTITEVQEEE